MKERIISNTRLILDDEIINGSISIQNGMIHSMDSGLSSLSAAEDWHEDYLMPGLVELHTDNMEKYFMPRPGVVWPGLPAMLTHDHQMSVSGITTVFDAVAVGYDNFKSNRSEILDDIIASMMTMHEQQLSRAEHFLHLRCELSSDSTAREFDQFSDNPLLKLVSLMDHAPGQRQFARLDKYIEYYQKKYGYSDAEMQAYIEQHKLSSDTWASQHRRYIADQCRTQCIPLASHDDATREHVDEALDYGVCIAEFPTTEEAAAYSHQQGLAVLMGAPNLIRGLSHSGNVSARSLANAQLLDIISSDYYPSSLLHSAFLLSRLDLGYDLPGAVACVTRNPALAAGLSDRGSIETGLRADLLRVRLHDDLPVLIETCRAGQRVS